MKDVTCNSQTKVKLKVTEIDKINIVSSQAVFELSCFFARPKSSTLVMFIKRICHVMLESTAMSRPRSTGQGHIRYQSSAVSFTHAIDFCLIDMTLHDNPDLVIDCIHIWDVSHNVRRNKVWCFRFLGAESQRFCVHDALIAFHMAVQQYNLGDVANSIRCSFF